MIGDCSQWKACTDDSTETHEYGTSKDLVSEKKINVKIKKTIQKLLTLMMLRKKI